MRREFLENLHCPFSGSRLTVSAVIEETAAGIDYGIVSSETSDFPIVNGILRLKLDEYRSPLVRLIKERKCEQALRAALEFSPLRHGSALNFADRLARGKGIAAITAGLDALKARAFRTYTDPNLTLAETVRRLYAPVSANWQIFRFSMPAFLPVYPLLSLLTPDRPVLDFGCGVGHAAFLISRRVPASLITCVDYSFYLVFLAKKFFAREATGICLDGNYLLPFESSHYSSVVSSDVLHLIDSKVSLSREFQRVTATNGVVILPHLHNRLSPIPFATSLSPEGYSSLFNGAPKRVVPEDWLVNSFIRNDAIDFMQDWTTPQLNEAHRGLSIVVSNAPVFRKFSGLWSEQIQRMLNPVVNPLYRATGGPGNWTLKKEVPGSKDMFGPGRDEHLPRTASLDLPSLDTNALLTLKNSNPAAFENLARKFVVIDVPERFL